MTKRAAPADPAPALLADPEIASAAQPLPRSEEVACQLWAGLHRLSKGVCARAGVRLWRAE